MKPSKNSGPKQKNPSISSSSPFKGKPSGNLQNQRGHNSSNASKDLENYLRKSSESLNSNYNFSEVDQLEKEEVKQPRRAPKQDSRKNERSQSVGARLTDLCPEDKAKVGELVKKLAGEIKSKKEQSARYEEEKSSLMRRLQQMEEQQLKFERERQTLTDKFANSLGMLKQLKDDHKRLGEEREKQIRELDEVKQELQRREEQEILRAEKEREKLERERQEEEERRKKEAELKKLEKQKMEIAKEQNHFSFHNLKNNSIRDDQSNSLTCSDQTITTLKEITELKSEIMKLTSSLKSIKSSPFKEQEPKAVKAEQKQMKKQELPSEINYDTNDVSALIDESLEREWWKSQKQRNVEPNSNCKPKAHRQETSSKKVIEREEEVLMSSVEDLQQMKLEDLHQLQTDLAKKLELTNTLLQSKLTDSVQKTQKGSILTSNDKRQSLNLRNLNEDKMSKLLEKAQNEYEDYHSSSPTPRPNSFAPEPSSLSKKEELLARKLEMFKEIQSRFKMGQEEQNRETPQLGINVPSEPIRVEERDSDLFPEREINFSNKENYASNSESSYYKSLLDQQTQILHQQKLGRPPVPVPAQIQHHPGFEEAQFAQKSVLNYKAKHSTQEDSDDDLAFELNNKGQSFARNHQSFNTSQPNHSNSRSMKSDIEKYDDSLFNIIDEIEYEQESQRSLNESQRMQNSHSRQPNTFFKYQQQPENSYSMNNYSQYDHPGFQCNNSQIIPQAPAPQVSQSFSTYKNNPYYQQARQEMTASQGFRQSDNFNYQPKLSNLVQSIRQQEEPVVNNSFMNKSGRPPISQNFSKPNSYLEQQQMRGDYAGQGFNDSSRKVQFRM